MIQRWWMETAKKFPSVTFDASVAMPDHFHGILLVNCVASQPGESPSLSRVIQWFKTMTTAEYFRGVRDCGWPRVARRLWQRGFYDHIIRNETELARIRLYVEGNPGRLWERYDGSNSS